MKRLIVLIALAATTLPSISQNTDSVTCLPNSKLREAIKEIERGKLARAEIVIMGEQIEILKERILGKDSIIYSLEMKSALNYALFQNYEDRIYNYQREVTMLDGLTKSLNKELKKQKRKSILIMAGVIIANAATTYFLLKK